MTVNSKQRDVRILQKIISYCDEADKTVVYFDGTLELLAKNSIFKNAVSMCILQIGELTHHLSSEFIDSHSMIPWRKITDMRNIAVHHYSRFSNEILWETITEDIGSLREYCSFCIEELQADIPAD